jgi:galactose oxidase
MIRAAFFVALNVVAAAAIGLNNGTWGQPVLLPLVPAAVALLHTGHLVLWSSYRADVFVGQDDPATSTTAYCTLDLATMQVGPFSVSPEGHDMFCPGTSLLSNGTLLVNGGSTSAPTTLYDPVSRTWRKSGDMRIPRGYSGDVTLSDGRVFTIGGSWSGGTAHKDAEVWSPVTGNWTLLPNVLSSAILTDDPKGENTQDNHAWLFARANGVVFHAGPSKQMNFFGTSGNGTSTPAGLRGTDQHSQYGNAVMFSATQILTVGGATQQGGVPGSNRAHVITLSSSGSRVVSVQEASPMAFGRAFHSSVVLPDGTVLVTGGQSFPEIWTDYNAVFVPELFDPATMTFRQLAPAAIARTYHSVAILLPDATVLTGGGGLCSLIGMQQCVDLYSSHFDGTVFTPPYLLNADGTPAARPVILSAPAAAARGSTVTVTTSGSVSYFSLVRTGASTHGVNNDQRRVRLSSTRLRTGVYGVAIPASSGTVPPGYWLLFVLSTSGVPSKAVFLRI